MNIQRLITLSILSLGLLAIGLPPDQLNAQVVHSDIRFQYSQSQIVVDTGATPGVATSEFPVTGFFKQFDNNPGFASENDVGLGINPGDRIVYNVLDDLLFWNGSQFASPAMNTQIRIENNNGAADTTVHGASGMLAGDFAPLVNSVGLADGIGDFHSHVDFFLEPNDASPAPELGVYGMQLTLSTDSQGVADSDPFFVVFNFGLDSQSFVDAVDQYASLLNPGLGGDFDNSGAVDGQDFLSWQRGEVTNPPDGLDLQAWQANYGMTSSLPASTSTVLAVPEPTTGWLALLSAAWALLNRRAIRGLLINSSNSNFIEQGVSRFLSN